MNPPSPKAYMYLSPPTSNRLFWVPFLSSLLENLHWSTNGNTTKMNWIRTWLLKFPWTFTHSKGLCVWVRWGNTKSQSKIARDGKEMIECVFAHTKSSLYSYNCYGLYQMFILSTRICWDPYQKYFPRFTTMCVSW